MRPTPRVQALLRAGSAERPPAGNEERLLGALGVGVGSARGTGAALAQGTIRTWLRWTGLWAGLWVALCLVGAAVSTTRAWAIGARAPRLAETSVAWGRSSEQEGDPPAIAPVTLEGRSRAERAGPVPRSHGSPGRAASSPAKADVPAVLANTSSDDELARVRAAKLALRRGDAGATLFALDEYARTFPRGTFREEAAALRVEALVAAGRLDEARSAGDRFAAAYPHSPYGTRVEAARRRADAR